MTLTFGSLFSGIGGIDLGFERAGMSCSWQVEIDDYCNRILEKHWPDVRRFRDVKEVGKYNLKPVDVITGGFPCQPHSVAGKQKGADDDRNLWPEYLRIIKELRPTWVVGENVPGIITTYLDTVLSDVEGAGYEVATFNLPAVAFDAPHRRERIFVVAYADQEREPRLPKRTSAQNTSSSICYNDVSNTNNKRLQEQRQPITTEQEHPAIERGSRWSTEPDVRGMDDGLSRKLDGRWLDEPNIPRVATGIPNRVDRLKGLGNAVVPAVAEFIARQIIAAHPAPHSPIPRPRTANWIDYP